MVALFRRASRTLPILLAGCLVTLFSQTVKISNHKHTNHSALRTALREFGKGKSGTASLGPSSRTPESIAACLLIKDDNDILSEWIAYHYYVMDMRYLLVAVDPSSQTSPVRILETWYNVTSDHGDPLQVQQWSDLDYMPQSFLKKGYHIHPRFLNTDPSKSKWHAGNETAEQVMADTLRITNHRFRQVTFLSSCLRHVKAAGRTWVIHIDTDEYVVVNPELRHKSTLRNHVIPISPRDASSIVSFLRSITKEAGLRKHSNYPCISMPRLLFGSVERDEDKRLIDCAGWNTSRFETLRWLYRTSYTDKERNAQPKVIIDVSKVSQRDEMFKPKPFSIHRPSKALCRRIDQLDIQGTEQFPLTVNHYLGSAERYFARNDTRRSQRAYEFKASVQDGRDDWITTWLNGFVHHMGQEHAQLLLDLH